MLLDDFERYLANSAFGIWNLMNGQSSLSLHSGIHSDSRKPEIIRHLQSAMGLGLVNQYLFPGYAEYESILSHYLKENVISWSEVKIPKKNCSFNAGTYKTTTFTLPENLFSEVKECFFEKTRFTFTGIFADGPLEDLWLAVQKGYDRKETIESWNGNRFGCFSGKGRLIMDNMAGRDNVQYITTFVMEQMLKAYMNYSVLSGDSCCTHYLCWSEPMIGNQHLRCRNHPFLQRMDNLLSQLTFIENKLEGPYEYVFPTCLECKIRIPEDIVKYGIRMWNKCDIYLNLENLLLCLNELLTMLDTFSEESLCALWNRCFNQKAKNREDIKSFLLYRCDCAKHDALSLMSRHLINTYERYISVFVLEE